VNESQREPDDPENTPLEDVWSYRGYRISPGQFTTAMVHLYRGEMTRSNTWRTRLDSTTNWAVVTTAAGLTFTFGSASNPHVMILLVMLLVLLFLHIEARRYRYYELWTYRVRLMETDFYSAMLVPPFTPGADWAELLAESLLEPAFNISTLEALGRRLRRNYFWLLGLLALSWMIKVASHPLPVSSVAEFFKQAAVGPAPGSWVTGCVALLVTTALTLSLVTVGLQQSAGEVLPRGRGRARLAPRRWIRARRDVPSETVPRGRLRLSWPRIRHEKLCIIITERGEAVAQRLLEELHRGVTSLPGMGMYTGKQRAVLLCAIRPTEVHHLKAVVRAADPHAFLVINPTQEVVGRGFNSFGS